MFETLFTFLEFLLKALPAVPKSKKRRLAKDMLAMYMGLDALVRNGRDVLKAVRKYKTLDWEAQEEFVKELGRLLLEQTRLVRAVARVARQQNVRSILSVRLPRLHPLLLADVDEGKGHDLKLFLETLDRMKANEKDETVREYARAESLRLTHFPTKADFESRIEAFDAYEIKEATKRLNGIVRLTERLRQFLATEFEIEDLA